MNPVKISTLTVLYLSQRNMMVHFSMVIAMDGILLWIHTHCVVGL